MNISFYKYQGTGNDFVILDNRDGAYSNLTTEQVHRLCDRKFGVGADGLMLLNGHPAYDFEMVYYNADGKEGSMCGNGGRCLVKFASHMGITAPSYRFIATDGPHDAKIDEKGMVSLKMKDVDMVTVENDHTILNTGSPHYVRFVTGIKNLDVVQEGRAIRYGAVFKKEGINVNFAEQLGEDSIFVRTYERGVEDETLSCGTGVTAAAISLRPNPGGFNAVKVATPGGNLSVTFDAVDNGQAFRNVWLTGPAELVYKGEITLN